MAALQRSELIVLALPERQLPAGLVQTRIRTLRPTEVALLRRSSSEGSYFPLGTWSLTPS
jgi:hypothetical protein